MTYSWGMNHVSEGLGLHLVSKCLHVFICSTGATSAPCLIFIFPAVFYIRIVPEEDEPMRSPPKILVSACTHTVFGFPPFIHSGIWFLASLRNVDALKPFTLLDWDSLKTNHSKCFVNPSGKSLVWPKLLKTSELVHLKLQQTAGIWRCSWRNSKKCPGYFMSSLFLGPLRIIYIFCIVKLFFITIKHISPLNSHCCVFLFYLKKVCTFLFMETQMSQCSSLVTSCSAHKEKNISDKLLNTSLTSLFSSGP